MFPYPPKLGMGKVFPNPEEEKGKEEKEIIITTKRLEILKLQLAGYLRVIGINSEEAKKIIQAVENLIQSSQDTTIEG